MYVHLPLQKVLQIFDQCLAQYGVGAAYRVGSCLSVGGFFKKLGRGLKKITKGKVFRGVTKAIKKVGTVVKNVVTHPAFRAGFAAIATAFPILAPAAAGLEIASRVINKIDKGAKAAKSVIGAVKGGRRPSSRDLGAVLEGRTAQKGIRRIASRAKQGDPRSKRAMGAIIGAGAVSRRAKKNRIKSKPSWMRRQKRDMRSMRGTMRKMKRRMRRRVGGAEIFNPSPLAASSAMPMSRAHVGGARIVPRRSAY